MGQRTSNLRPEVIKDLKGQTYFTQDEIQDLYRQFRHDCLKHGHGQNLHMKVGEFKDMYKNIFPKGDSDKFAEHVFRTFDKDRNGVINFRDFITTLSIQLKGTPAQKLEWLFELYDIHGNGYITREEASEMITMLYSLQSGLLPKEDRVNSSSVTDHIFSKADKDQDDKIDRRSFILGAEESRTMKLLLEGTTDAVAQPYQIRKERTGSFGLRDRSNSTPRQPNLLDLEVRPDQKPK